MGIDALIAEECTRRHVPGVSVATIEDGCVASTLCFGSRAEGLPVVEGTVFEAASMSKPVTAYMGLRFVEQGLLSLDEPLRRYTAKPYVDDPRIGVVTARHTMTHQTGLWRDSSEGAPYFERDPMLGFKYSNDGLRYLQSVLEEISGETVQSLAERLVFEPLGMRDSSYVWRTDYAEVTAIPHDENGTPLEKWHPPSAQGDGSLHTTARDYARFAAAAMAAGGEWLTPQVEVHEVWGAGGPEPGSTWGLGWGLQASDGSFWHWGWNIGFLSFAVAWPDENRGVVAFTNGQNGLWICKAVVSWFSGGEHPAFRWLEH